MKCSEAALEIAEQKARDWQMKCMENEQMLAKLQEEFKSAQALIGKLMPVTYLYQYQKTEQCSLENKFYEEWDKSQNNIKIL